MTTISRPAASAAAVAALLLSGIGVSLPSDSTRADDHSAAADDHCAKAPGAAAPAGQHWYFSLDRVKHRKCWYLHATMPLPTHVAAKSHAAASQPVLSVALPQLPFAAPPQFPLAAPPQATNAASASQPAATTSNIAGETANTQPAPHVTVLAVKTVPALFVGAISAPQAATSEQSGEPPTPQISSNNANVPMDGATKPESGANPAIVPAATDADRNAVAPADTAAAAAARMHSLDLFFLLALALGLAAALIALLSKMAGRKRTPRLSGHPDDAWRRVVREEDAPFLAPREPHRASDSIARRRMEQSPPARADFAAARRQDREPAQSEQASPTLKDIELALRAIRQARQSINQT